PRRAAAPCPTPPPLRQILADLVEETLAQDPEPAPAVGADDPVVVGADDTMNRFASHRSGSRRRPRRGHSRAPAGPAGRETPRAARSRAAGRSPACRPPPPAH